MTKTFGQSGDKPIVGNWRLTGAGDKTSKFGVFRDPHHWRLDWEAPASSDGAANRTFLWGLSTDLAATGNWDGDAVDEIGILRGNFWYMDFTDPEAIPEGSSAANERTLQFGIAGDSPLVGRWERS